ncbi:hypothetical protein K432DRAFT_273463, partial [Lepidopterella palustris CBS 459.81]
SSSGPPRSNQVPETPARETAQLPHLTPQGSAHMVSISDKANTVRTAIAVGRVIFSNQSPLSLIRANALKKGDVMAVARIAGIMAAKKCPEIVPLCHPVMISHVSVNLQLLEAKAGAEDVQNSEAGTEESGRGAGAKDVGESCGGVEVEVKVSCTGATGVEMEALTAVMSATLTVYDMCKAVDKGMRIEGVRVVLKEGGRSGTWKE